MFDSDAENPAHLFIELWRDLSSCTPSDRSNSHNPGSEFREIAYEIAGANDPGQAVQGLLALINSTLGADLGRKLGVMRAIDDLFAKVHPRVPRIVDQSSSLPPWMTDLVDQRYLSGAFAASGDLALIARGPLIRTARDENASSADSLADRFAFLSVVPLKLDEKGQSIAVRLNYIGMDMISGVMPIDNPGNEKILFVPLAESEDELEVSAKENSGNWFAYYGPADSFDCTSRFQSALDTGSNFDMAVLPELVVSPEHTSRMERSLRERLDSPRLVLLGTENSIEEKNGQPFNEAILTNSIGTELWRQRKLWPAQIDVATAQTLGICSETDPAPMLENNTSGHELLISDIDGFGRVVVLICQDIQLDIASTIIERFQPDWVLLPILDHSILEGRWAHSRSFALSMRAQSRFVAVTSQSLGRRSGSDSTQPFGMALGPFEPATEGEPRRAVRFVGSDSTTTPVCATATWNGEGWAETRIEVKTPGTGQT